MKGTRSFHVCVGVPVFVFGEGCVEVWAWHVELRCSYGSTVYSLELDDLRHNLPSATSTLPPGMESRPS